VRRWLTLALGVLTGQWLAFSGVESPASHHGLARQAWERHDYVEAVRSWSRAASLQPDNPTFHFLRANALARLGHRTSAAEAYQVALLLEPGRPLAQQVEQALIDLDGGVSALAARDTVLPLEAARGVWVARATFGDTRSARLLVDTGASVTVISPQLAAALGLSAAHDPTPIELETLTGRAAGPATTVPSLTLGGLELRDIPAVIYDPGFGVDGILGNTVLGRFTVTLDADRRILHLRSGGAGAPTRPPRPPRSPGPE
jgi:clan AA aspartic protease (TIGR02281 family)